MKISSSYASCYCLSEYLLSNSDNFASISIGSYIILYLASVGYFSDRLTFFMKLLNIELNLPSFMSPSGTKFSRFFLLIL